VEKQAIRQEIAKINRVTKEAVMETEEA